MAETMERWQMVDAALTEAGYPGCVTPYASLTGDGKVDITKVPPAVAWRAARLVEPVGPCLRCWEQGLRSSASQPPSDKFCDAGAIEDCGGGGR